MAETGHTACSQRMMHVCTGFVAEVTAGERLSDLDLEMLRSIAAVHSVIVFRALSLNPLELVELASSLGPAEIVWDVLNRHPLTDSVQILSNQGRTPSVGAEQWHTDRSFMTKPTRHTLLYPVALPHTGGDTLFADMKAAYQHLSPTTQETLEEAVGVHSYGTLGSLRAREHGQELEKAYADECREARHPIVRAHPETNEPALYLNALCLDRVESPDGEAIDVSLDELYQHATDPRFVYAHRWRSGDVVIWDNACVMHRGTEVPNNEPRVLHRTTTQGNVPRPYSPSLTLSPTAAHDPELRR